MSTGCSTISISRVLLGLKLVPQAQNKMMRKLTSQDSQKRKLKIQLDALSFQYQIISTKIIPRPLNPNSAGCLFMKALLLPKPNSQPNGNCLIYLPPPSKNTNMYGTTATTSESPPTAPTPPESPATLPQTPPEEKAITGSPQAWGPIEAPITKEWLPHIQHMYRGYPDFKLVPQYPELNNTVSNPEFTVYKTKDFQFLTIYQNNTNDGSLALCIPQNCRRIIDGELHELRETIIRGGHRTLGHASGEKTCYYLKDYFYWPSMR